jgi:hypothetical protein
MEENRAMNIRWYYQIQGGHTHVRVFMNGAKCGDLRFRNEEFEHILDSWISGQPTITDFINQETEYLDAETQSVKKITV